MNLFRTSRAVSPAELQGALAQGATLVDVRTEAEWHAGHIPGARHVPVDELPDRADELQGDGLTIVVCRSGHRSAAAAALLSRRGVKVANLSGGLAACQRAGLPLVRENGAPGTVL